MNVKPEIKLLEGFGELKFGAEPSAVENYMGEPQEIEDLPGEADESDAEVWNYWEDGHTLFFDKEQNHRFTCFETDNDEATLFGKKVFDLNPELVIALMKENNFTDFEQEEEEWGETRISFDDAVTDFYFEDNRLISVSWGVMIDLETEEVQWPS